MDDILNYCNWYIDKRWEAISKHHEGVNQTAAPPSDAALDTSHLVALDDSSLMPMEALVRMAEVVASCVLLGLAGFIYMPGNLVDIAESPCIVSWKQTPVQRSVQHWAKKVPSHGLLKCPLNLRYITMNFSHQS